MIEEPREMFVIQAGKLVLDESGLIGHRKIDEGTIAHCDLCNVVVGTYNDIKYDFSPEAFARAVRNGLLPERDVHELARMAGIAPENITEEIISEVNKFWKELALNSETRWVVCEKCHVIVESFLRKDKK